MPYHLPTLIIDLALILCAGAVVSLIFKKIKQPLVLGYIIAGFLVGPYISFIPTVADTHSIEIWAEIGVIFLLFSLGLEFSFSKLMNIGGTASITAIVEMIFVTILGYIAGLWMGWTVMQSVFLGALLASSSTTIILRVFEELKVKRKNFAHIVVGTLVVEDIVIILLMVVLTTVSVSQNVAGLDLLTSLGKLLLFLTIWFIFGVFLIPTLLRKASNLLNDEILLVIAVGLCFIMVVLATKIGFSAELGAFITGSILAETIFVERIEHLLKPLKELFGAIFFISIGMMIDPHSIIEYKWTIIIVILVTIFGKFFFTALGATLSGQPLKQSVRVGMSMAQIGEFAFIIAKLGKNLLGDSSAFLLPVAVGASAVTTFTTPYMIKYSDNVYLLIEKILPRRFKKMLNNYSAGTQNIGEESYWNKLIKSYTSVILINVMIILGITVLVKYAIYPFLINRINNFESLSINTKNIISSTISFILTILLCSPFLWAILKKDISYGIFKILWNENKYNRGPLIVIEICRVLILIILIGFILDCFFSGKLAMFIIVPIILFGLYILSTKFNFYYSILSKRFMFNLNERKLTENKKNAKILPWDMHLTDLIVNPNTTYIGKNLQQLEWREKFGINVAYIKRGTKIIYSPKANNIIYPYDQLGIIGTDKQLKEWENFENMSIEKNEEFFNKEDITFTKFIISEYSSLLEQTIQSTEIEKNIHGMVIGIERKGERILNPPSNFKLMEDDLVWIVGDKSKINNFIESSEKA